MTRQVALIMSLLVTTTFQLSNSQRTMTALSESGGRMHRAYLEETNPLLLNHLILTGKLHTRLLEIEDAARSLLDSMMPNMAKEAGATKELKARNPLRWVGLMNNCKARAEEIILTELIYI